MIVLNFQKEEALIKEKEEKFQQHQTYLRVSDNAAVAGIIPVQQNSL